MNKKIVLFDFDGVIVDTWALCLGIVMGREHITEQEYRDRFEGNIFEVERNYRKPLAELEDFTVSYAPKLMKCVPVKEMDEAIRELSKKYTLVIVSSSETPAIDSYLKSVNLRSCFAEILGMDVDKSKVNKINRVLADYKVNTSDAVFITDTLGDMKEAEKCGVKCIGVIGGYHPEETLKKGNPLAVVGAPKILETVYAYFGA